MSKKGQANSYIELKKTVTQLLDVLEPICYYPLLVDAEMKSDRALSILTLVHLITLMNKLEPMLADIVRRLVMQVIEGLIDTDSRQQFERMIQQQPKSRYISWKKRVKCTPHLCREMKKRPVLMQEERELLKAIITEEALDQVLELNQTENDDKSLYFICNK
ncbi:uncharacterized protein BX663DRAFT_188563 [Cokeromyces recurvatus]|uniref:uncharacterized protein n=1 Tax=Cokeromyces recurvatus TaxID=90255 RepID=UPI00221F9401|nr:uncharacterized protein BX663DRAFT_188563 [Cokeromyces recurvatus]KAI7906298.1 hypothetical protein BX663DRAFT_188563 [Cokeromyces recurvatus]